MQNNSTELNECEELGSTQSHWLKYVHDAYEDWSHSDTEINEYFEK